LLLLFQIVSPHAAAVVTGVDICTSDGSRRVSTDDPSDHSSDLHHDCCCTVHLAAPPVGFEPVRVAAACGGCEDVAASKLAAQWLAPLSRGPPPLS
jgi:hypothetical protein